MKLQSNWQPTFYKASFLKNPYNISMKKFYTLLLAVLAGPVWAAPSVTDLDSWQLPEPEPVKPVVAPARPRVKAKPQPVNDEPELIVEMGGAYRATNTQDPDEIPVMRRSATQLARRLANKGRFYVLLNANVVSTQDSTITAKDGTRYAYVRFGKDGSTYRKFLFEAGGDQKLVAVADSVPGVLQLNARYGVNIGPTENDFKRAYPNATVTVVKNEQENKEYHSYQIEGPVFLIFENGKLVQQFAQADELAAFMQTIGAANTGVAAQQAKEQTELEKARLEEQAKHNRHHHSSGTRRKALVEGGTLNDQMYLPQVTHPEHYQGADLPALTPSGPKAGTVLMRDVDGKYMNNK